MCASRAVVGGGKVSKPVLPFRPTHELVLTDRAHQAPRMSILVSLESDGMAYTAEEWRDKRVLAEWSLHPPNVWHWRMMPRVLPPGYTTLRVKRVHGTRALPVMGPTTLRAGSESTNLNKTYRVTASEWEDLQAGAKRAGKPVSRFVADAALAEARKEYGPVAGSEVRQRRRKR